MYTIVMGNDKSLKITCTSILYQHEKLVDKMRFLLPQKYEDFDLSEFIVSLKYIDQSNVLHVEQLDLQDELYKDKLCYILPIDTKITRFSGDIIISLVLTKVDLDLKEQHVLHSGTTTITINPLGNYYQFTSDESLDFISRILGEFEATRKMMQNFMNGQGDESDGNIDGIIDLDNINEDLPNDSDEDSLPDSFIEL